MCMRMHTHTHTGSQKKDINLFKGNFFDCKNFIDDLSIIRHLSILSPIPLTSLGIPGLHRHIQCLYQKIEYFLLWNSSRIKAEFFLIFLKKFCKHCFAKHFSLKPYETQETSKLR